MRRNIPEIKHPHKVMVSPRGIRVDTTEKITDALNKANSMTARQQDIEKALAQLQDQLDTARSKFTTLLNDYTALEERVAILEEKANAGVA